MLKLVCNIFSELKVLIDDNNNETTMNVTWTYVKNMLDGEEKCGIHAASKLTPSHVNFHKHKMKVKLAAQDLSSSVADALYFLREDMKDPSQIGNEATVRFIRVIDQLFAILNSDSPCGTGLEST